MADKKKESEAMPAEDLGLAAEAPAPVEEVKKCDCGQGHELTSKNTRSIAVASDDPARNKTWYADATKQECILAVRKKLRG